MGAKLEILQVNGVEYRNTNLFVKTCTLRILDFCGGFYHDAPWHISLIVDHRNCEGDASSEASRYGGHVMCVLGAKCQVVGVLGFRRGQENVMGRCGR